MSGTRGVRFRQGRQSVLSTQSGRCCLANAITARNIESTKLGVALKFLRIVALLACMLFGMVGGRIAPPLIGAIIGLMTLVAVSFLGKRVLADFQKTDDAEQLSFRRFEAAPDKMKRIALTIFYVGTTVFGIGIVILISYFYNPQSVLFIPQPLLSGALLAGMGLVVAGIPKFVIFSK